jgi:hypothetical protein
MWLTQALIPSTESISQGRLKRLRLFSAVAHTRVSDNAKAGV